MKDMVRLLFSVFFIAMGCVTSFAQLNVTTAQQSGNWAEYYVNNVLLGTGVTAFNITFLGDSNQLSEFDLQNSQVNISEGVLLTTGDGHVAEGPNNSGGAGGAGTTNWQDVDLAALSGVSSNDGSILEFDFVPMGDTIKFNYVFASEEYDEYTCGGVNDAFGFFLSGPGISGPFSNGAENIALVPGTNVPVSINTVNLGAALTINKSNCYDLDSNFESNSIYYQQNLNDNTIQYDGHTVKLTAIGNVICGDTYHIKLAIGDGGDQILDSGVFLEAGSFTANIIDVGISSVNGDSTITEGCGTVEILFSRSDVCLPASVGLSFTGVAQNGIDFPLIPDSIHMAIGQQDTTIVIAPYADGLFEGQEPFTIIATRINFLGDTFISTGSFVILDSTKLTLESSSDTLLDSCYVDSIMIGTKVLVGGPSPYHYVWNTGDTVDSISIPLMNQFGIQADTFIVRVTDSCEMFYTFDTIYVFTDFIQTPRITVNSDTTVTCPGDEVTLVAVVEYGLGPFHFNWPDGSSTASSTISVTNDMAFQVTVTDECGLADVDSVYLGVRPTEIFRVEHSDTTRGCPGFELEMSASGIGGVAPYLYDWVDENPVFEEDSAEVFVINQDTLLTVWAQDFCGRDTSVSVLLEVYKFDSIVARMYDQYVECPGSEFTLKVYTTGGFGDYTYEWETGDSTDQLNLALEKDGEFMVTVTDFCMNEDTAAAFVSVEEYASLAIDVGGAGTICYGSEYDMYIFGSGGAGEYEITGVPTKAVIKGESFEKLNDNLFRIVGKQDNNVLFTVTDKCGNTFVDSVSVNVDHCLFVPNVITPNGDGFNDAFTIKNIEAFSDAHLRVYNRWGTKVFESEAYKNEWDANDAPAGTYFYTLKSEDFPELRGDLTVLRD